MELVPNGGAFGGKEDMSIQAPDRAGGVAHRQAGEVTLTRDESFRLHPKRHPIKMHVKVGCDADGRITAVRARIIGDKGAYASVGAKVLERAAGHASGPYRVPERSTSKRSPSTRTIRPAARCAASAPTSPRSPSSSCSIGWPRKSASTAGRSAGGTSSTTATASPPARSSTSRSAWQDAASR